MSHIWPFSHTHFLWAIFSKTYLFTHKYHQIQITNNGYYAARITFVCSIWFRFGLVWFGWWRCFYWMRLMKIWLISIQINANNNWSIRINKNKKHCWKWWIVIWESFSLFLLFWFCINNDHLINCLDCNANQTKLNSGHWYSH